MCNEQNSLGRADSYLLLSVRCVKDWHPVHRELDTNECSTVTRQIGDHIANAAAGDSSDNCWSTIHRCRPIRAHIWLDSDSSAGDAGTAIERSEWSVITESDCGSDWCEVNTQSLAHRWKQNGHTWQKKVPNKFPCTTTMSHISRLKQIIKR